MNPQQWLYRSINSLTLRSDWNFPDLLQLVKLHRSSANRKLLWDGSAGRRFTVNRQSEPFKLSLYGSSYTSLTLFEHFIWLVSKVDFSVKSPADWSDIRWNKVCVNNATRSCNWFIWSMIIDHLTNITSENSKRCTWRHKNRNIQFTKLWIRRKSSTFLLKNDLIN